MWVCTRGCVHAYIHVGCMCVNHGSEYTGKYACIVSKHTSVCVCVCVCISNGYVCMYVCLYVHGVDR